jgi:hypothetical protein
LTPKSMRSLMWVVDDDQLAERRGRTTAKKAAAPKRSLRAVDSSGA